MPVLIPVPQDPTDLVLQGEEMRVSVLDQPVDCRATMCPTVQVFDEDQYLPMNSFVETGNRLAILRSKQAGSLMVRVNAGIATPVGTWVPIDYVPLVVRFNQATNLFTLTGVSRDSAGAALGNCRVMVLEVGRLYVDGAPLVAETISDGSGNFSVSVPMNTAYQILAYKPGSPDVTGATLQTLTPEHTG